MWVAAASLVLSTRAAWADMGDGATGAVPSNDVLLASPGTLPGIDVSHHQGSIDWTLVAASGVRFAIAKATEGRTYVDPTYVSNTFGARLNGIVVGGYHFARPDDTPGDAVAEADHFVDHAALEGGDLLPVLDIERTGGLSQSEVTAWILTWLDRVTERVGVRPMVYTSPHGWLERTGDTTAVVAAGYMILWVAHWDTDAPRVPAQDWGGHGWTFWQYGDCGAVAGIEGCVDVDAYAGTSFEAVSVPTPDLVPPTASLTTPVGGPATVAFDEVVRGVTPRNTFVWVPEAGTHPDVELACRSGKGVVVACETGSVRTVAIHTAEPLVPGESYEAVVNPTGVSAPVVDRSGNAAPAAAQVFVAATAVDADDPAVRYAWRRVGSRSALGGSYAVERSAGATASFAFRGRSVTWYTATGRDRGLAAVWIDGERVGAVDGYSPRPAFRVSHRFDGLRRGAHVIAIRVLGRSSPRASDTLVAVDGFGVRGRVTRDPALTETWGGRGGVASSDLGRSSAELTFRGTGVTWITSLGPDRGRAAIVVDGALFREVDTFADAVENDVAQSVMGLAPGIHTLRVVVVAGSRPAATGFSVSVDGFTVSP